jgi:hypothetical protein
MSDPLCTDEEFIRIFEANGAAETMRLLGYSGVRQVYTRRKKIEKREGIELTSPIGAGGTVRKCGAYDVRIPLEIKDGSVVIFSDAHYWPGEAPVAHRGLLKLLKEIKPKGIIANGDVFDGASISRHPPIGFAHKPTVKEELEVVDERLEEIRKASPKSQLFWNAGNHDLRFESRLAGGDAAAYMGVKGFALSDHFPAWKVGLSIWINEDVVVKHRWKGGVHATHNNTVNAGKTFVSGHLHSLKVTPFDDYNGTRWGVDTGCLADPYAEGSTDYMEDNPRNWRSGFIVLTFVNGKLLWPEVVRTVGDDLIDFRGKLIKV